MSDGMTHAPAVAEHRHRRRRRPPTDRFVQEQIRAVVLAPLVIVFAALGGAALVWRTGRVPAGHLLAGLACAVLVAAVVGALRAGAAAVAVDRAYAAQLQRIREAVDSVETAVVWSADELCRGGRPLLPQDPVPGPSRTAEDQLLALVEELKVRAVASLLRVQDRSQSAVLLELVHQFSQREHALVDRALERLDQLQDLTDDPDLLAELFTLDHLVTRMRRWVESKAVVAGESLRSAREPVSVMQVLRGANQEILHYERVTVAAGTVGATLGLPRHVGPDLTHLLAELVENATQFSDPASKVQVRAHQVPRGLAVEVEDRVAIPMRPADRQRWNALLADPGQVDMSTEVQAGRLGLLTAARIAHRHNIDVQLAENPVGGTTALVVVPERLLVQLTPPAPAAAPAPVPAAPARDSSHHTAPCALQAAPPADPGTGEDLPQLPRRVASGQPPAPAPARAQAPTTARFSLAADFQQMRTAHGYADQNPAAESPAHP
ncbi:ATP-binding protein [Streptomyces olivaceus]|uniref:ATP-binding protein n=1 Tax=Streptomyces olivaceus TaxID=47716 RepID=UPI001884A71D|nr:ATP-binding protein [Streptomyces olivaceus]